MRLCHPPRDYWARFERFVKKLGDTCEEVFVVTGALFAPALAPDGGYRAQHAWVGARPAFHTCI